MFTKAINLLKIGIYLVLIFSFFGCEKADNDTPSSSSVPTAKEPIKSYINIPALQDRNITLYDMQSNEKLAKVKLNSNGSFVVDINKTVADDALLKIEISGCVVGVYTNYKVLKERGIEISLITLLAGTDVLEDTNSSKITQKLSSYAKKLFRVSLNSDIVIDYKDLNSFVSNFNGEKLFNPNLLKELNSSGFIDAIRTKEEITLFKSKDNDGDGVSWEEEILIGSSDTNADSDGDGISDYDEGELGTSPLYVDSDFDGLSDLNELHGETNPIMSDSDGDYFSDFYELARGMNPLEADENGNGILDGLEGDPFFKYQWYLKSDGTIVSTTSDKATLVGNDLGVLDVYRYKKGTANSIVQVIDTGVEYLHEDLNVSLEYSRNSVNKTNDPTATRVVSRFNKVSAFEIGHGTAVAGIIGAIAHNGVGVRGVVPNATIAGSNWLEEQSIEELDRLWYSGSNANEILVSNNSWGSYKSKDSSYEAIMRVASRDHREGKGRIFVFASGNEREIFGNANLSYIANNRYAITVASLNHENRYSYYSNPGSNILVSAYGGSSYELGPTIATTLLTGKSYYESELGSTLGAITFDDDLSRSYTFTMNGTSAATPMVSGAITLVLESCPDLTWRDVRWLLSYKSKVIDRENEFWVQNAAGRFHNINYGYGLIDADAMIKECRSRYYTLLPEEKVSESSLENINVHIPDSNSSVGINIDFREDFILEWLELVVDSDHPYAGDYEIDLISPQGTRTQIITPNEIRSDYYKGGFRFSSAAFMGERTEGIWRVEVFDRLSLDSGTVTSLKLKIYGHEE